jgi:hypothetical protein
MLKNNRLLFIFGSIIACVLFGIGVWLWTLHIDSTREQNAVALPKVENADMEIAQTPKQVETENNSPENTARIQGTVQDGTGDTFPKSGADQDFSKLSLKELLAIVDELEPEVYFPLMNARVNPKVIQEYQTLSDEEKVKLETAVERAFPELIKNAWEEQGLPVPPPGHTYYNVPGEPPLLVKYNTEVYRIIPAEEGYGRWDKLSAAERKRYNALQRITSNIPINNRQISREVPELAEEWKQQLYEKTWGSHSTIHTYSAYKRPKTEVEKERDEKLYRDAQAELKRSMNVPKRSVTIIDPKYVETVISELEAALNRR